MKIMTLFLLTVLSFLISPFYQTISSAVSYDKCEDLDINICGFTDCYWTYYTDYHKSCDRCLESCCLNSPGNPVCYERLDCSSEPPEGYRAGSDFNPYYCPQ